jgi:hypothetical protein
VIVEAFATLLGALVGGLLHVFAALIPPTPGWVDTAMVDLATVWGWVKSAETWVPASFALTCALFVVGCYVVSWSIMLGRMVLSYLTLGGGAT